MLLLGEKMIRELESQSVKGRVAVSCGRGCWFERRFIQIDFAPSWKTHSQLASSDLSVCDYSLVKSGKAFKGSRSLDNGHFYSSPLPLSCYVKD